jgi:hydrogenase maturation protease
VDIRILGLGNVLMGDDGFGPFVVEALGAGYDFAENVTVLDVGTPGLDLAPFLMGADTVIVLDTVRSDGPPGTLRLYRRHEILKHAPQQRLGPHDPGLKQALLTLDFAASGPRDVLLVGVSPETTAPLARLSSAVRNAVPVAVHAVLAELERLDARAAERVGVTWPIPWWERVPDAQG